MRKLLADTSISNNPKIIEELKKAGWKSTTAYRQEKGTRCYQFGVLYRFENSSVLKQTSYSKRVTDKQVTHYATGKTAENNNAKYWWLPDHFPCTCLSHHRWCTMLPYRCHESVKYSWL